MAANQARDLMEDREIIVIPTKTIPQGISAMICFSPELSVKENTESMTEALSTVHSAEVTYAVRNTSIDGHAISEGDIMVIGDAGLLSVEKNIEDAVLKSAKEMIDDDSEILTLYYGKDVKEADAEALADHLRLKFKHVEVELQYGGQPIYYYFLSVE